MTDESLYIRVGGRDGLRELLHAFYADVRQHAEIGPIFASHVDDWPSHLEKIADFWSGVTGGPRLYSGPMPFKHAALGLEYRHFEAWLSLWRKECQGRFSEREADAMIALAEAFGERIQEILRVHALHTNRGTDA